MTRIIIVFLAALSFVGGALASPRFVPPTRYDFKPSERIIVVPRTSSQIRQICTLKAASPWPGGGVGACTLYSGKSKPCIILWPKGTPRAGTLWRHERAHCNGWSTGHSD
jgi:hypothetical protein